MHYPAAPVDAGKPHVFIATPVHSAPVTHFTFCLYRSALALRAAGIAADLCFYWGDPHVDDARNVLVAKFLATDCTDLVFIDADMHWSAEGLVRLLEFDRDVIGGTYPFKGDSEPDGELTFGVTLFPGAQQAEPDGALRVKTLPTGFLRIRRAVLEALAEAAPKFSSKGPDPALRKIPLIFERTLTPQHRVGGDYTFCFKAGDAGFEVYLDPEQAFGHVGTKSWNGCWGAHMRSTHGLVMPHVLNAIRGGTEKPGHYVEIFEEWGNDWAAGPDMLTAAAEVARSVTGPVLECGSGLSTLILAAAVGPEREVLALEHDPDYHALTEDAAKQYGLPNVRVVEAPLVHEDSGEQWYGGAEGLGQYQLIVVDGPPRLYAKSRGGAVELVRRHLAPGGVVLLDDAEDPNIRGTAERIAEAVGGELHVLGEKSRIQDNPSPFFAIRRPVELRGSVA